MKKILEKSIVFENYKKEKLWGVLTLPKGKNKVPAVLLIHGFNGTKSARKFVKISRELAENGIASLRFDFSGCGESEGEFKDFTIKKQVKELKLAYQFLIKESKIDKNRIAFLGHSLGGLVSCLLEKDNKFAKTLILIAPAFNQKELSKIWCTPAQIKQWRRQGYADTPKYRVGVNYLNEAEDYTFIASKINVPVLIIHGQKDKDVPIKFSKELVKIFKGEKELIIFKKTNHDFESYQDRKDLPKHCLKWLKKYL